ncbi:hemagglutinin repeat-containing protein [Pseudomonas nitroreducens]|uniref:two-partner secretion domain-containing protein n=1 Tax=Pseudomonas nitroreducens TaxID=46680 RepID=UPI003CC82484
MDIRHPACKLIASVLSGLLILNPIVAAAAELAVDAAAGGNTSIGAAGNGVPVINIATPNGAGLSHNKFSSYGVGPEGLILNNSTQRTQSTELGGIVVGNPNLRGQAAQKILNEVTSNNLAKLQGYTEVAGQAAHVIVAAPGGVYCNGCGFINTPRATLTTGKPLMDGERLRGYDIDGGSITIDGKGLNASNVDRFEILTRSAKLNADLYANQLTVVTGRNQVDADSLAATAKLDDGSSKPQLAIDSSALGGMYAGVIRLVGTEQGVGVKLAGNMAASAGDIQIDANGQLSLAQTSAAGSLRAKAQDIALTGSAYASTTANLRADGQLTVDKSLASGGQVQLNAAHLSNTGQIVSGIDGERRIAGQALDITVDSLNNRGRLDATGAANVIARVMDNSGQVYADRIALTARDSVDNRGTLQGREVTLTTAQLNNLGASAQVVAEQALLLDAPGIANLGGLVRFGDGQAVALSFINLDNRGGRLEVNGGSLTLNGGTLGNQHGTIVGGTARVDAQRIDNQGGLIGSSHGDLTLASQGELNNDGGKLQAARDLKVDANAVGNRAGTLVGNHLGITAGSLDNRDQGVLSAEQGDLTLQLGGALNNSNGIVQASGALSLGAGSVNNVSGKLLADSLTLIVKGDVNNNGGTLVAEQLNVSARSVDNESGRMQAKAALKLSADDLENSQGLLLGGALDVKLGDLSDNTNGTLSADGLLKLVVRNALDNTLGRLQSVQGNLDIHTGRLENRQGALVGSQLLLTAKGQLDNRGGRIAADGIQASAGVIDNSDQGQMVAGKGGVSLIAAQRLSNNHGRIQSEGSLELQAPQLENRGGTALGKRIEVSGSHLDNSQGGALVGDGDEVLLNLDGVLNNATGLIDAGNQALIFTHAVASLGNQGGTLRGERIDLLADKLDNSAAGRVLAGASGLSLKTAAANNQQGLLYAQGGAVTVELGAGSLLNQAGTVQGDTVKITAAGLDNSKANGEAGIIASLLGKLELLVGELTNRGGQLFAKGDLNLVGHTLDNGAGQISGASVTLTNSGALSNQNGLIESSGSLALDSDTLDNSQGGRLRALGGDSSHIRSNGQLNNQGGSIGVASQGFELSSGAMLLNGLGEIQHAGSGLFRLGAADLVGAGTLTGLGSGWWQLGSLSNVGQIHLNGALNLHIDHGLGIGAGERIASASDLTLTAASLNNQGELLSDGDLSLTLDGDAYNTGTLSAQRGLALNAADLTQRGGRLASGQDTQLNLTGNLDNQGWLIANQALRGSAAQIINNGTLGALGALSFNSASIANGPDSLLFSGGDMTLRTASLSNRYGDLYSQGSLDFAGQDGGRAQSLSNRSGILEAQGDIHLNVASLENVRDIFDFEQTTSAAQYDVRCGQHCGGHDSYKRGKVNLNETIEERITQNSPAAWLTAGRNLTIDAGSVENRNSTLAANGDLTINAGYLLNQGNTSRTGEKTQIINTVASDYGDIPTGQWDTMARLANQFNARMAQGIFDQSLYDQLWAIYNNGRWVIGTPIITWSQDDAQSAPATLQAGNRVTLNVTNTLQNGTVADYSYAQLTGELAGSLLGQQTGTVNLTINKASSDAQARGPQTVETVTRTAPDGSQQISFIPVDYTGVPFAAVDPSAADTFRLPQGQYGLFIRNSDPDSHYLIETNPALTDQGRFLSSDYLLGQLGYDADKAWKRLGDGAYETRLIREAIQAKTGQRFLDGLASDYDLYQYLMDNALAAKSALQLSVGVGLSAEQVAALTHDIVWLESRVIDGQQVLVPVVYLAQTDERNMRGGSLIQGRDLNLISGGNLINVGTLRASNDLNVVAGGSILQGGLIDAGQRISLLAGDSIRNALAGQIRGDQIDLTALRGDIVNDRTAVTGGIGGSEYRSFLDSGSSISARSKLSLDAGRDITNRGALSSGGDAYLSAGRDINLEAVTDASRLRDVQQGGHHVTTTTIEQNHASSLTAGGNLSLEAGRDLNVVGSKATAGQDLAVSAGRDVNVVSTADYQDVDIRSKDGKERIHEQDTHTRQQASELAAGGDLLVSAGQDITLAASKIAAGNEAYLVAGDKIELLAANDNDYSLYDSKEKGSWGKKKTQRDEVTDVRAVGSEISAGSDITLLSNGDQKYQGAKLEAGNDIAILSGGEVTFEAVKDLHQEAHEKTDNSVTWNSSKGKGATDEAVRQSELIAQGSVAIHAVDGLNIDYKHIDKQSVSQAVDAMVQADPSLGWLKEAEARGDVDWRAVKEMHDSYKYSHSGMSQAAMLAVIIVVTVLTAGAASGAIGAAAVGTSAGTVGAGSLAAAGTVTTTVAGVTTTTAVSAGWANIALSMGAASLASTGAVSAINNKGNIGTALSDTFSSDSLKQAMISAGVAGTMAAYGPEWFGTKTDPVNGTTTVASETTTSAATGAKIVKDLETWTRFAGSQVTQGALTGAANEALGQGKFSDAMQGALYNILQGSAFDYVGSQGFEGGSAQNVAAHALTGGLLAEAMVGDFRTGAIAAGASEALVDQLQSGFLSGTDEQARRLQQAAAQIVGIAAAASVNGDVQMGGDIARSGMAYNSQLHEGSKKLAKALAEESDGRFTPEQIEAAMRIASIDGTNITPSTDMVAALPGIYDAGGNWVPLGSSGLYVQNFEKADPDVIAYIKENLAGYTWTSEAETGFSKIFPNSGLGVGLESEQRDRLTGSVIDADGKYALGSVVGRNVYYPEFNSCADTACLIYGAGLYKDSASTNLYFRAKNAEDMNTLGKVFAAGVLAVPAGATATGLSVMGTMATITGGYYSENLGKGGQYAVEDYIINYGLSKTLGEVLGNRVAAGMTILDVKGVIKERAAEFR